MTTQDAATWAALAQLYLPFAGLLGVAYWVGVLHQKVKGLERDATDGGSHNDKITRLETQMGTVINQLGGLDQRMFELAQAIATAQPPPYRPRPIKGASQ